MQHFRTSAELRAICLSLPQGDAEATRLIAERQATLTKPPGSLGRLEELVGWLGRWQGRCTPQLDRVEILIFAGNHGVVAQGVSPYPPEVTRQMVANFAAGGAAINQLAHAVNARLRVIPLSLDRPTADFTTDAALSEAEFVAAVSEGYQAVDRGTDLLCVGEMGIGNTTSAAALAAALFGGHGDDWAGRGTGIDDDGLSRKRRAIDAGLALHVHETRDGLAAARLLGGRETAAILGAVLAARMQGIPVLLDGFVCTAAAAPLTCLFSGGLDHTIVAHASAEAGHRRLLTALGKTPLLDLGMRLGEASGAAVAIPLLRCALACHTGMASFAQAGVTDRK